MVKPKAVLALKPADAARRMRITVKTLRHYERRGLLKPGRTAAGWRVYEREDLGRLEQILAFRAMGFQFAQIAVLLDASAETLASALVAQELHLNGHAKRIGDAIETVRRARRKLGGVRLVHNSARAA